jgi:hypothetical protein
MNRWTKWQGAPQGCRREQDSDQDITSLCSTPFVSWYVPVVFD